MQVPDFAKLRKERTKRSGTDSLCSSYAQGIHPNPRFYKYYWWIFWDESPCDGWEFLSEQYRLNSAAAVKLLEELKAKKEPYWMYNSKVARLDPKNPFDPQSPYWEGKEWALGFDEDPDPMVEDANGALTGHK